MSLLRPGTWRICIALASTSVNWPIEDVPHRLPIHGGRFHRDLRTQRRGEPVREFEQGAGGGRDRAMLIRHIRPRGDPHTRRGTACVDVETGTTRIQDFHQAPPQMKALAWSPLPRNLKDALTGRAGAAIRGAPGTPGPTRTRAVSTIENPTSVPAPPVTGPCFIPSLVRRRRVGN